MIKLLKFDDSKFSSEILKILHGRKFFAVSIVDGEFEFHVPDDMMKTQIVFGCELLKNAILNQSLIFNEIIVDKDI